MQHAAIHRQHAADSAPSVRWLFHSGGWKFLRCLRRAPRAEFHVRAPRRHACAHVCAHTSRPNHPIARTHMRTRSLTHALTRLHIRACMLPSKTGTGTLGARAAARGVGRGRGAAAGRAERERMRSAHAASDLSHPRRRLEASVLVCRVRAPSALRWRDATQAQHCSLPLRPCRPLSLPVPLYPSPSLGCRVRVRVSGSGSLSAKTKKNTHFNATVRPSSFEGGVVGRDLRC